MLALREAVLVFLGVTTLSSLMLAAVIAERTQAQEALRTAFAELEVRVQERTQEIRLAAEELARSNAELEQFAYVASHDLQEPLRAVAGTIWRVAVRSASHFLRRSSKPRSQ